MPSLSQLAGERHTRIHLKSRPGHVAAIIRAKDCHNPRTRSSVRSDPALAKARSLSAHHTSRAGSIQKAEGMLGNLFRQKTGVVLRRRAGDWHMYVIGAFAGVIGGFYIWLEPLRQLQLEGIRKAKEEEKK